MCPRGIHIQPSAVAYLIYTRKLTIRADAQLIIPPQVIGWVNGLYDQSVISCRPDMMTSSNGNISALLAICAGNSPVTGEFPIKCEMKALIHFQTSITQLLKFGMKM